MVVVEENINGGWDVKHNNREFSFTPVNGNTDTVELTFVRTLFRKSDVVTDEYPSVSDIPPEVRQGLEKEGVEILGVDI